MFKRFQVLDLFDEHESKDCGEWVDTTKELPGDDGIYWVRLSDGEEQRAYYCKDQCERMMKYVDAKPSCWWCKKKCIPIYNVTHWMPLPLPPSPNEDSNLLPETAEGDYRESWQAWNKFFDDARVSLKKFCDDPDLNESINHLKCNDCGEHYYALDQKDHRENCKKNGECVSHNDLDIVQCPMCHQDVIVNKNDTNLNQKYRSNQTCRFCDDPKSILTKDTCCTGCSRLENK